MAHLRVRLMGQGLLCWHSIDSLRTPTIGTLAESLSSAYNLPPGTSHDKIGGCECDEINHDPEAD